VELTGEIKRRKGAIRTSGEKFTTAGSKVRAIEGKGQTKQTIREKPPPRRKKSRRGIGQEVSGSGRMEDLGKGGTSLQEEKNRQGLTGGDREARGVAGEEMAQTRGWGKRKKKAATGGTGGKEWRGEGKKIKKKEGEP